MLGKVLLVISAYLLGSIPTAVWIGKKFFKTDVRKHGSGNAGATNTFRVLGKRAGIVVLLLDVFKGFLAVRLPVWLIAHTFENDIYLTNFQIICGLTAVLGHIYPIFAQFKGGKGVATLLGIFLGIIPEITLLAAVVFFVVWLAWGYISLSSIIASLSFPLFVFLFPKSETTLYLRIIAVLVPILMLLTHKKNIMRLVTHQENKMPLFKKKKH